jgi:hypothetical protein
MKNINAAAAIVTSILTAILIAVLLTACADVPTNETPAERQARHDRGLRLMMMGAGMASQTPAQPRICTHQALGGGTVQTVCQ